MSDLLTKRPSHMILITRSKTIIQYGFCHSNQFSAVTPVHFVSPVTNYAMTSSRRYLNLRTRLV